MEHRQNQSADAFANAFITNLYQQYALSLMTYVRRHVPSREDAEDIVLEVYVYQVSSRTGEAIDLNAVWSPDGTYIASVERIWSPALNDQSYIIKVWVA